MPFPRKPPDKQSLSLYKDVSKAVDELYSRNKVDLNRPIEERVCNNLLPSNLDSSISAENLKEELLGKLQSNFSYQQDSRGSTVKQVHCEFPISSQAIFGSSYPVDKKRKVSQVSVSKGKISSDSEEEKNVILKRSTSLFPSVGIEKDIHNRMHDPKQ